MSVTDLQSLEATIELLADPAARDRLRLAEADVAAGDVATLDEMDGVLADRRRRGR